MKRTDDQLGIEPTADEIAAADRAIRRARELAESIEHILDPPPPARDVTYRMYDGDRGTP